MNKNQLSIIIPTYNYEKYIEEAILSALASIELIGGKVIVVNDASTDSTGKIIEKYKSDKLECITFEKRQGSSIARTKGALKSDTEYILFLDSDDVLLSQNIHAMFKIISKKKTVNCIYADFLVCDENLRPMYKWSENRDTSEKNQIDKLCWDSIIGMPAMIMKKKAFMDVGMFYKVPRVDDWDLAVRLMADQKLRYVKHIAHKRRTFQKTTWEKSHADRFQNFINVLNILKKDKKFSKEHPQIHKKRFACMYRFLAETSFLMNKFDDTLKYVPKAEKCVNSFADGSILKAMAYNGKKNYKKVIDCLKNENRSYFLNVYPYIKYNLLKTAYKETGNVKGQIFALINLNKIKPEIHNVYQIAKLYFEKKEYKESLKWFDKLSLMYDEKNIKYVISSHFNKAKIYIKMNLINNAVSELTSCLKHEPLHNEAKKILSTIKK